MHPRTAQPHRPATTPDSVAPVGNPLQAWRPAAGDRSGPAGCRIKHHAGAYGGPAPRPRSWKAQFVRRRLPWQVVAGFRPIRQVEQRVTQSMRLLGGHDPRRRRLSSPISRAPRPGAIVGGSALLITTDRRSRCGLRSPDGAHACLRRRPHRARVHEPAVPNRRIGDPSHHPDQCTRFGDPLASTTMASSPAGAAASPLASARPSASTVQHRQPFPELDGLPLPPTPAARRRRYLKSLTTSRARPGRVAEQRVEQRRLTGAEIRRR